MDLREMSGVHVRTFFVPGQATAGTEDDWTLWVPEFDIQVTAVKWVPNAAVTADGTNYFILQLLNAAAVVASRSYVATNSVALTPETMTLSGTAANLLVDAGDVLAAHKETTGLGTGLAMPDGLVQVHYVPTGV
ncbi:hypothetical protein BBK14_01810 [Parafrankia soli]|uniref:Uncharacterized protein n=1 Tax=Parafrankia soli TaxID=2599596 RepID=A0A1S1RIH8_9ACTN|nr:hypothetical protein [Parafrankia soli]OHV46608.1 hypothetical protein BBK14_01810 [Parafrankia soli]